MDRRSTITRRSTINRRRSSRGPAVVINEEDSICLEEDSIDPEKFTLTFYPDEADPLDKEKIQRIWNHVESKLEFKEMMVTFRAAKKEKVTEKLKISKKDGTGKSKSDESHANEIDNEDKTNKQRPKTAIELLERFRKLHMFEACLKKTGKRSPSDCLHCPSTENLDDIRNQIKRYEENLVTQVIGEKKAKQVYKI